MDFTEYRQRGKEMVDYIADYLENIRDRRVFPDVKPGYMKNLLPDSAPLEGEQWDAIFGDVERVIMPGITHWQSPHMHAYFPALNSFPSLLGDMLADAINCLGFTWASSPACTELEIIVMNWLGKMINLPDDFLHLSSASRGGGVVQTTASEATLVCLLAGRTRAIQRFHEKRPGYQDAEINARLVAYCSDQAHSSVEKAALIGLVRMRYIEADENLSMRGQLLREAIEDDIRQGLVPFWVCATLGTTGSCSFDNLEEIGIVCREFNLWLHVDAAYAGSAFICPEFRTWLKGIERADSIAFNPSKWLMIHFDATALWVKDSTAVHRTFNVEPLYLQHENSGVAVDFMHWQIPLSRRFRALKIWFVLRSFGIKGLQRHIREGVRLAQKFEALVAADHRFEIPAKRHLGLVVFRIKGENEITERLLKRLNHRGNLHCIPSSLKGKYVIRFTVTSTRTTVDDILRDWMEIKNAATAILDEMNITISNRVYLKDTKEKCEGFGSSLLLSNSPLSPKIVNGSFAALFDADEFLAKTYAGIRIAHQESPSMRRRVRGILMSGKQFSLDSHMDVVVQTSMNSHTTNSKGVDCYGNTTTANVKNEERDAICEDEESLEDCELNWILNTALQLNPTNYLAILKNQKLTPIDIIHHQNNLSLLTKYTTKYEVKNFTKSVNSVRTPLTQYQLYKSPLRPPAIKTFQQNVEMTDQQTDSTNLYPGKRYLNLDLTLHNDSIFTDSIFNLPTPTEDVIPIIITADTPTTTSKDIPEIKDLNKLRPPNSSYISILDTNNELEVSNKLLPSSSILIPIIETADELNDLTEIPPPTNTCGMSNLNKAEDFNKFQSSSTTSISNLKSANECQEIPQVTIPYRTIFGTTTTNTNPFIMQTSATNVEESSELNNESNIQPTKSSALVGIFSDFKELNSESNIQTSKYSIIADEYSVLKDLNSECNLQPLESLTSVKDIQSAQFSTESSNSSISTELNNEGNIQLSKYSVEHSSISDLLASESNIEPLRSSIVLEDSSDLRELSIKCNIPPLRSSTVVEYSSVFNELNNESNIQPATLSCDVEESSIFELLNNETNIQPLTVSSVVKESSTDLVDFSVFTELNNESSIKTAKSACEVDDSLIFKEFNNECKIKTTKSSLVEDSSVYKQLSREDKIQMPTSSIVVKALSKEGNMPQNSSVTAEASTVFQSLNRENHKQQKIFNSKSRDDSSSSDEFLESVGQPSNDSEGSSSATSSLELM